MELWSRSTCCFNGSGEPLIGDRGSIDGPGLGVAGPSLKLSAGGVLQCLWHLNDTGEIKTVRIRKLNNRSLESLDS